MPSIRTKEISEPKKKPRRHGTRKGYFVPANPEKYEGDATNIFYRSKIELRFMKHIDSHPDVIGWTSEEVIVPYYSPLDKKWHRYFVDFKVTVKTKSGAIRTKLIEVKWSTDTVEPKLPKSGKRTRRYMNECERWIVNQAKWAAAQKKCVVEGWDWGLITEKTLSM